MVRGDRRTAAALRASDRPQGGGHRRTFTLLDYEFCGICGLYKYRGNVILEGWQVERDPVKVDADSACCAETV